MQERATMRERRNLWLSAATCEALAQLSGGHPRDEAALMRAGIEAEIARRRATAPVIDAETAALLANARARKIDVRALLTAALTNQLAAEAATQQPAA